MSSGKKKIIPESDDKHEKSPENDNEERSFEEEEENNSFDTGDENDESDDEEEFEQPTFEDLPEIQKDEEPEVNEDDKGIKIAWRFPRLYKLDKSGSLRYWEIGFDGVYLRTRFGKDGCNKKGDSYKCSESLPGTLIKAKVKRNLLQQSLLEGRNLYNLQIRDKDFAEDAEEAHQSTEPTLANDYNYEEEDIFNTTSKKKKSKIKIKKDGSDDESEEERSFEEEKEENWAIEAKLDGIRARAKRRIGKNKRAILFSRKNVEFGFLEEYEELAGKFLESLEEAEDLDGELYVHGQLFQKTMSALRRTKNRNTNQEGSAVYFIFDFIPSKKYANLTYAERHKILKERYAKVFGNPIIKVDDIPIYCKIQILDYIPVSSNKEIVEYLRIFESMKFEGAILRKLNQKGYENGKSNGLLKVKSFKDEEGIITDIKEGKGRMKGKAIFEIQRLENKVKFTAAMSTTDEEKRYYFKNKKQFIGEEITYKHQPPLSTKGKPRFPIAIAIRDYEKKSKEKDSKEKAIKKKVTKIPDNSS